MSKNSNNFLIGEEQSGNSNQETAIRKQRSGNRDQETAIRKQQSGIRDQESEISNQRSAIRDHKTANLSNFYRLPFTHLVYPTKNVVLFALNQFKIVNLRHILYL